ncbi:DUF4278 domain-containing protein [Leptolyngbya iicbica LK]|uniref:DUF4278 domain-containing protein n=2 Tax=Cyanophyceae TaxID=3028117 RepID=A0A4Q7EA25_9CYAN|nr:DUF4278 domain-containing protein [Leptolyngbya sp. LK]
MLRLIVHPASFLARTEVRESFSEGTRLSIHCKPFARGEKIMTLRYRGAEYATHTPQVQLAEEVIGQYRGATVTRHVAKNLHAEHVDGLIYRGAKVK